jgi:hypothetical protein
MIQIGKKFHFGFNWEKDHNRCFSPEMLSVTRSMVTEPRLAGGAKSADHHHVAYEQGSSENGFGHLANDGVPLKMQITYEGHFQSATTLTDTNVSFITS